MSVLKNIEPCSVFNYFEQLCSIPHGSGNTKQISDFLVSFAKDHKLEYYQDSLNNVIIIKEASPGYENSEPVILQGHMDMVCEKAPGCPKNMETDGLDICVDGDSIYAEGTTLGGDDGIAVAMGLAVLASDTLEHPRIELVVTVDEEIGMTGAFGIELSMLKGRRMINIDSEAEGVFTVSCAGGMSAKCMLPVNRKEFSGEIYKIAIGGLKGGHSGAEIDKGRANADILMGRVLYALMQECDFRLVSVEGGLKENAIPVSCTAEVSCSDFSAIEKICREAESTFRNEYASPDGGITISVSPCSSSTLPMDEVSTGNAVTLLMCAPNGIQEMSCDIPGLVQTSLNLGILKTEDNCLSADFSIRSSIASQKKLLAERLRLLCESIGADIRISGDYPGWQYMPNSPLREIMCEVFEEQYGYSPVIEAIHAGLECGLFSDKLPGLDCISIGPDITDIHTFREQLHIASVERTWKLLIETLKRLK